MGKLKIVYPICCGMDVHRDFLIACIASTNGPGRRGTFGYGKGCPDPQGNYGKSGDYGVTNMRNKKLLLYLIGTEALLILCIALANLNLAPVLYFII